MDSILHAPLFFKFYFKLMYQNASYQRVTAPRSSLSTSSRWANMKLKVREPALTCNAAQKMEQAELAVEPSLRCWRHVLNAETPSSSVAFLTEWAVEDVPRQQLLRTACGLYHLQCSKRATEGGGSAVVNLRKHHLSTFCSSIPLKEESIHLNITSSLNQTYCLFFSPLT